ncbi:MAG: DMT family transporter [Candidatus Falkowbacteria bacterium]
MKNFFSTIISVAKGLSAKRSFWLTVLLAAVFLVIFPHSASAGLFSWIGSKVIQIIGWVIFILVTFIAKLLLIVIDIMVAVAQYNGFISAEPVVKGWAIVRDLCNMFFILVLLVIAFGTILHVSSYNIKTLFKGVLIGAILINFSKTISGLIIDFSQVVTLTFVAGFKDVAGGNFVNLLGIEDWLKIDGNVQDMDTDNWGMLLAYLCAFLFSLIALITMIALLMTFVFRMVFLWIYVILSPLAYLLAIFPHGKRYSGMWWSKFTSEVVVGPILAFFIWLCLATLGATSGTISGMPSVQTEPGSQLNIGITTAGTANQIMRFVIAIGLLIGGLTVAKSTGAQSGAAAGGALKAINKGKGWVAKKFKNTGKRIGAKAKQGAVATAKFAGRQTLGLAKGLDQRFTGGLFTSVATSLRYNVFSKDAWRRHTDNVLGRKNRQAAHEEAVNGYYTDADGVRYESYDKAYTDPSGVHHAAGALRAVTVLQEDRLDQNGNVIAKKGDKEYGDYLKKNGRDVKSMSAEERAFYEGYHGAAGVSAKDVERRSIAEKSHAERMKKYEGLTNAELMSRAGTTANEDDLRAIYQQLMKNKGFPTADLTHFKMAYELFKEKSELAKAFNDLANETMAWALHSNLDDDAVRDSLITKIRAGKVDVAAQKMDGITPDARAAFYAAAEEAQGSARFAATMQKREDTVSPKEAAADATALVSAAEMLEQRGFNKSHGEAFRKHKANGLSDAEAANRADDEAQEKAMNDPRAFRMRRDSAFMNGDLASAFTYKDKKNPANPDEVDHDQVRKFIESAKAAELAHIDTTAKGFDKISSTVAGAMSYKSWVPLLKIDPESATKLAENMAKHNAPDAEKFRMHINSLNINEDAVDKNGLISSVFAKAGDVFAEPHVEKNNLDLMNEFREHLDPTGTDAGGFFRDNHGNFGQKQIDNMKQELKSFIAMKAASGSGGYRPPASAPSAGGGAGAPFAPHP